MNSKPLVQRVKHHFLNRVKISGYQLGFLPHRTQLYSAMKIYELETAVAHLRQSTGKIVDLCCGTGIQTQLLARRASRVIGVDNDRRRIRDAYWHLRHSRFRSVVSFVVGGAEALPLPTDFADAVVCLCAIEHIRDPEAALREVVRIMKPGGVLSITADSLANVDDEDLRRRHRVMYGVHNYFDVRSLAELLKGVSLQVDAAFPMLCSAAAVRELERCMADPRPVGPVRTLRLLRALKRGEGAASGGRGGLFVFAAASKPLVGGGAAS